MISKSSQLFQLPCKWTFLGENFDLYLCQILEMPPRSKLFFVVAKPICKASLFVRPIFGAGLQFCRGFITISIIIVFIFARALVVLYILSYILYQLYTNYINYVYLQGFGWWSQQLQENNTFFLSSTTVTLTHVTKNIWKTISGPGCKTNIACNFHILWNVEQFWKLLWIKKKLLWGIFIVEMCIAHCKGLSLISEIVIWFNFIFSLYRQLCFNTKACIS